MVFVVNATGEKSARILPTHRKRPRWFAFTKHPFSFAKLPNDLIRGMTTTFHNLRILLPQFWSLKPSQHTDHFYGVTPQPRACPPSVNTIEINSGIHIGIRTFLIWKPNFGFDGYSFWQLSEGLGLP